ncbi:MAG: AbrB/MazE/SpoVT family DNA-binding domain-containing protein, partial [Tepidiformaceae bacterium]
LCDRGVSGHNVGRLALVRIIATIIGLWHASWMVALNEPESVTGTAGGTGHRLVVGKQGRIVVPSEIRKEMGLADGDVLIARLRDGRVVLEREQALLERARRSFAHLPSERSLVDELLAERQAEAARDAAE